MQRTIFGAIAASALVLSSTALAVSQTEQPQRQERDQEKTFTGQIVEVDEETKVVTVQKADMSSTHSGAATRPEPEQRTQTTGSSTMQFTVNAQTEIQKTDKSSEREESTMPMSRSGASLELGDLNQGDLVTIKYTESGSRKIAQEIQVRPKSAS